MAEFLASLTAPLDGRAATSQRLRTAAVGVSTFVFLTSAAAAHGGYFPGSWGWLTLVCAWTAALALLLDAGAGISRAGLVYTGLLAAYAAWSALSALWSVDATSSVLEAQRNAVYVAGAAAALLLARHARGAVLVAAWASIVALAGYALLTRLVPDRFGVVDPIASYRLDAPVGYWNALSLLAAVGALLAIGLAARARLLALRIGGAASLPLLVATMYYTFSRGGWASLIVGVAVLVLVDPRRLQALWWLGLAAAAGALAVLTAAHDRALSTAGADLAVQAHAGHRTAGVLVVLCVLTAAAAAGWAIVERRVALDDPLAGRRTVLALAAAVAIALVAGTAIGGAPWSIASRTWHGFTAGPPAQGTDLAGRVFHLSGSGRVTQWKVAWREAEAHPLAGSGAATWERYWDRDRPTGGKVRNVHNLYLEALATLGIVGALILCTALLTPLAAGVRLRATRFAPFALGAFATYLAHAIVDWDWQLTGVSLPVLAAVAAVLLPAGPNDARFARPALYALATLLAAVGLWGIASQTALSKIHGWSSAQRAADLQPWSTEPWSRLAERDIEARDFAEARRALDKAIAKDAGDWQLWFDLARASSDVARVHALAEASRLDPKSPEVAGLRATLASLSQIGKGK